MNNSCTAYLCGMSLRIERTTSANPDFRLMVMELDHYLNGVNGGNNDFFAQFNKLDLIKNVVVAYEGDHPVGCGAIKQYATDTMEVKRMFVPVDKRGRGIAGMILTELETWAKELGYKKCILETALSMEPAVALYKKSQYTVIPNYDPYIGVDTSICFEKLLS